MYLFQQRSKQTLSWKINIFIKVINILWLFIFTTMLSSVYGGKTQNGKEIFHKKIGNHEQLSSEGKDSVFIKDNLEGSGSGFSSMITNTEEEETNFTAPSFESQRRTENLQNPKDFSANRMDLQFDSLPVEYKITIHVSKRAETLEKLLDSYDKEDPPSPERTKVTLSLHINGFNDISETTMDYSITFFLHQQWHDTRLRFNPEHGHNLSVAIVKAEDPLWTQIWMPDSYFRNEKIAKFHKVSVENRYVRIFSDGIIQYSARISACLSCNMNLFKYPLDTQNCSLLLESFATTDDTQVYEWHENNPITIAKNLTVPKFRLVKWATGDCTKLYTSGSFSCKQVDFIFKRDIGYYIIQMYFPSVLVVILSWVAFWISFDAVPARVTMGLLTVLTISTQNSAAQSQLPRVSYIKALDVWMSVCLLFVFTALIEFAIVNVYSRREAAIQHKYERQNSLLMKNVDASGKSMEKKLAMVEKFANNDSRETARKVDKLSRKLFPATFVVFNIFYWVFYMKLV